MEPRLADLGEILAFTRVVQRGGFSAAARDLGMPKSTVSRKVSELEGRVGARLLQRTTRRVSLTDVGRVYYDHCVRIVAELEEAQRAVAETQATPTGPLRVTAPLTFSIVGPVLAEYLRLYPSVDVELVCTDRRVDLIEERFDLAIRAGQTPDSTLVARKLGALRRRLLASPALMKRLGRLREPEELSRHPVLAFLPEGSIWRLRSAARSVEVTVRPRLVANDFETLLEAARAGAGIALVPELSCDADVRAKRLVEVLPEWSAGETPVFALYPSNRHLAPKVTAMVELLRKKLFAESEQ
jgi:DNA-binding transcriptional LysR family regulator